MKHTTYLNLVALIFLVIGVTHVLRIVYGWDAEIGGVVIAGWVSWVAAFVSCYLAYWGFKLGK